MSFRDGVLTISSFISEISAHSYNDRTDIHTVIIPNTVTSIRRGAFENCTNLRKIHIPNSVTYMSLRGIRLRILNSI